MQLIVTTRKVVGLLSVALVVLVLLHLVSYVPVLRGVRDAPINMLNMDGEQNLSALFSTMMLWLCSALTWFIARLMSNSIDRQRWLGLAVIYLYLGFDESMSLHERLSGLVNHGISGLHMASFAWLIPYALILVFFVFIYLRLWLNLPGAIRIRVAVGGMLFVAGGMGCEFVGWLMTRNEFHAIAYHIEILCEEMLEMIGTIFLVSAFLNYIGLLSPSASITLKTESACRRNGTAGTPSSRT